MGTIKINYERAKENNVRTDAERAIKLLLSGEEGECLTILPQALNPLLKALESIGMWKNIMVLPYFENSSTKAKYLVVKTGSGNQVESVEVSNVGE